MKTITTRLSSLATLFRPLLLAFIGVVLLSLSIISLVAWAYQGITMPEIVFYLTLQFLPGLFRSLVLALLGLAFLAAGIWKLSDVMVFRLSGTTPDGNKIVLGYQRVHRPPRIVVLSGGAGMLILASLGKHVERLTCITPIQDPVEYYYRASSLFEEAEANVYYVVPTPARTRVFAELDDGTVQNVMTVNLDPALAERHVARLMLVSEQEPASAGTAPSQENTSNRPDGTAITPLAANDLPLTSLAREALHNADIIVLGPGSLFESVLPNLLLDNLRAAIQQSSARKIYICNLMTEPGLTTGFGVGDHIRQIKQYGGFTPDYVLVNVQRIDPEVRQIYADSYQIPVSLSPEEYEETTVPTGNGAARRRIVVEESVIIEADLASSVIRYSASLDNPDERQTVRVLRHDPQKLTAVLLELLQRE